MNQFLKPVCPKCGESMAVGFLSEQVELGVRPERWVEGQPEISIWQGTKTLGKEQFQVATYRCSGCGYLESYANDPVSWAV